MRHLTREELDAGLNLIRQSPNDSGVVKLIVRRPHVGAREIVEQADLDPAVGLVGDNWSGRSSSDPPGQWAHVDTQLNVMNSRVIALVAQDQSRWPLAGDQLFVDLDLSDDNLPPGTQLAIGSALIQVSAKPHTGCQKFGARFGVDVVKFVNSEIGRKLHLRGINARVTRGGTVRVGDLVTKQP